MVDYYRNLLSDETKWLNTRIEKYNKILDKSDNNEIEPLCETVVGQIRLVIGQSNLFINERFKQFSGLIDDCELKRGEKETKVEDLAGFWDMIYYQVEDLKVKYSELEKLEANKWIPVESQKQSNQTSAAVAAVHKPSKPVLVNDNKANIIKNRKPTFATTNGGAVHHKKPTKQSGTLDDSSNNNENEDHADGVVRGKKPVVRSNFREFLKNKRKEMSNGSSGDVLVLATNGNTTTTTNHNSSINGEGRKFKTESATTAGVNSSSSSTTANNRTNGLLTILVDDANKEN